MAAENDRFFVHVIESPSSEDLLDGRTEGRVLIESLNLSGVPSTYCLVTNRSTLLEALGQRLSDAFTDWRRFPILHLSLHGTPEGIVLTNDDFLSWHDLRQLLLPINQAIGGALIVCLSSCFSSAGCRMAMYENGPVPFLALVGHSDNAQWSDAAVGFVSFYHRLRRGTGIGGAVEAMRQASGDLRFEVRLGQDIQGDFVSYLSQRRFEQARQAIGEYLRTAQDRQTKTGVSHEV